jgi:hypothetical protein
MYMATRLLAVFALLFFLVWIINIQQSMLLNCAWRGFIGFLFIWFNSWQGDNERDWVRWCANTEVFEGWWEITFFAELFTRLFFVLAWVSCYFF